MSDPFGNHIVGFPTRWLNYILFSGIQNDSGWSYAKKYVYSSHTIHENRGP